MDEESIDQANKEQAIREAISGGGQLPNDNKDDKLIDPQEVKQDLRASLMGVETELKETKSGDLVEVERNVAERQLCNERGFSRVWATVEGVLNTNVTGGYLSKKEINRLGFSACSDLALQLWRDHDKYGIESVEDYHQIMSIVAVNLKSNLSKARGGRGLRHNEQTLQKRVVETLTGGGSENEGDGWLRGML